MTTAEKHDEELTEAEILKGVPALLPPEKFRQRQRSAVLSLMNRLRLVVNDQGEVDMSDGDQVEAMLSLLGDADDFFESIAADRDAYVEWAQGLKDSENIFGTLISKYGRAVGE